MTWSRIDENAPHHPKSHRVGLDGFGFHVAAVCFANRFLTDGRIRPDELELIFPGLTKTMAGKLVRRLVDAGLWEENAAGWQIHDFLDYNPSASDVRRDRDAARDRQRAYRRRRASGPRFPDHGENYGTSHGGSHTVTSGGIHGVTPPNVRDPDPVRSDPTRPDPEEIEEGASSASPLPRAGAAPVSDHPLSPKARIRFDPTTGKITGIEPSDWERWRALYPAVDLEADVLRAADWLLNNPTKRRSNVAQFLSNWFQRTQDKLAVSGGRGNGYEASGHPRTANNLAAAEEAIRRREAIQ